ncbi:MAG: hypothetical protein R3236_04240 [Phycisphaeraceae bacterium]|nr:hypothetical protein [Phycisphaeraceae bacterium]
MVKPTGEGGPWKDAQVKPDQPSDPYLMSGYDRKTLSLTADREATITVEVDLTGTGLWSVYRRFDLKANEPLVHTFPDGFSAYWVRVRSSAAATATAWFRYE